MKNAMEKYIKGKASEVKDVLLKQSQQIDAFLA